MNRRTGLLAFVVMQILAQWNRLAGALLHCHVPRGNLQREDWLRKMPPNPARPRDFLMRYQISSLYSTKTTPDTSLFQSKRASLLNSELKTIGVNSTEISLAARLSIEDPTSGYDDRFGKSALRTYRSFIYPKKNQDSKDEEDSVKLSAAAARCARQVEFLIKRHKSHQVEWVRHHDSIRDRRQVLPLVLVLDNVRSAFNVGSLYRTADACGCQLILTCGITPHPGGSGADKLAKSALGAELLVQSKHFAKTQDAIQFLRQEMEDFEIIGMETTEKSQIYTDLNYTKKIAIVLGNEVTGVDTELMPDLDAIVEIPTFGAKNSLNVAACAPVVLYEIIRQWNIS